MARFEPRCIATTLHIVPFRDPIKTCHLMVKIFPEAPSVPRFSMSVRMYMGGMPCLIIDQEKKRLLYDLDKTEELGAFYDAYLSGNLHYFAMDHKNAPGFYGLLDVLSEGPMDFKLVHLELPGPITWGLSLLENKTGKAALYDPTMRDVLVKLLYMKARWQEEMVRERFPGVLTMVTLGEPSLGVIETAFGAISAEEVIASIDEILSGVDGLSSVHCCSNMNWPMLMNTKVKVINFDAYKYADKFALYPQAIADFLKRGGMLAWGIVPVNEEELAGQTVEKLFPKLEEAMNRLVKGGVDFQFLLDRSFITPCCAPSAISPESAQRAWFLTSELSKLLRTRYYTSPL